MKKTILVLSLVAGYAVASAQKTHTEIGIKGGVNIANLKGDNDNDFNSRTSFHVGGLAHIHVANKFAVQPEVTFSGQGARLDFGGTTYEYKINYLNVPVLLQYMVGTGFRIETGPQLGLLLNAKLATGGSTTDVKEAFNSTDVSWAFGLGYITSSRFGFDGRYNLGLTDITKNEPGNTVKTKNNVFQLGVFYQFQ